MAIPSPFKKSNRSITKARRNTSRNANRNKNIDGTGFRYEQLENRMMLAATYVPNELLVQFLPGEDVLARSLVRTQIAGELAQTIYTNPMIAEGMGVMERISISNGLTVESAIARIGSVPGVAFAEPNWINTQAAISDDTRYTNGSLWNMYSDDTPVSIGPSGTTNTFGTQAEQAWNNGLIGSNNVYIGVIDEGIDFNHPDLGANVWTNPFDPVDGVDNDGNGRIDDIHGWDFYNGDNSIYDGSIDDHGTHVAGTIGGVGGNGVGVAGVNWNVTMISAKFLEGGGTTANAILAFDYLTDLKTRHGLNIVATNNSWGGGGFSQGLLDAITRSANAQILMIAAAGNTNSNTDSSPFYPANYSTLASAGYESVISVASITSTGAKSSFSSYGATTVDLGAPGSVIWSTLPGNTYGAYSGTSMATPHVSGAAALYASANAGATASQIRDAILNSVAPTNSMSGITVTGGRLDIESLMSSVDPLPSIEIEDVSVTEGNTGTSLAVFTVSLSAASSNSVSVDYDTLGSSASSGSDFDDQSGTLTFAPNVTTQQISIVIHGDLSIESDEVFFINLTNPINGILSDAVGQGTIVNDDFVAVPIVTINNLNRYEGNAGTKQFRFTVSLNVPSSDDVSVNYATSDGTANAGSDYGSQSETLVIPAGETRGYVTVLVNGDRANEFDETFFVDLSSPVNGVLGKSRGTGTILNDDVPKLRINNLSRYEGNTGFKSFSFKVSIDIASVAPVTVSYTTIANTASEGSDYRPIVSSVTINPGELFALITVQVTGDTTAELDETFFVNLFDPINATIIDSIGVGTILNDDIA
jgi:subtilisin family serine protease